MKSYPVISLVQQLFDQHNISYQMEQDWLVPYGQFEKFPAVRVLWFPYEINGCLQVEVLHADSTLMIECFAGIGHGDEAILDGFQNFCANSFHVFAVAFWNLKHDDQVEIQKWKMQGEDYIAYIGCIGSREIDLDTKPVLPENWFESYIRKIKSEQMLNSVSWFRLFVADHKGHLTVEVLKNNDIWLEAQQGMAELDWIKSEAYYSIRNFIILVKES